MKRKVPTDSEKRIVLKDGAFYAQLPRRSWEETRPGKWAGYEKRQGQLNAEHRDWTARARG